jgi:hypothetical protein
MIMQLHAEISANAEASARLRERKASGMIGLGMAFELLSIEA